MTKLIIVIIFLLVALCTVFYFLYKCKRLNKDYNSDNEMEIDPDMADYPRIKVIFDNNSYDRKLETSWGFSCIVEKTGKTILFDTGGNGEILMANMDKMEIDPGDIDIVFLSHIHGDHVGGACSFLEENSNVAVYVPASFPEGFNNDLKNYGADVKRIEKEGKICEGVYSTGELGEMIEEQSLVINTESGLVIITGCAHPGIVNIIKVSKKLFGDKVFLVMGGFHLSGHSRSSIEEIVEDFKNMGVRFAGPCHCSGDAAREIFGQRYGENYIDIGAGRIVDTGKLGAGD
jgi:7,8-dihydropterin-6-yl-methyl-4-(beta-D-ribofuranosyl)aminobenzene 5'-phosphate synthase